MNRPILPLVMVALACAACDPSGATPDQPLLMNATFRVYSLNDSLVPRLTATNDCQLLQEGGQVTLYANGEFTMHLSKGALICGDGPQGEQGFGGTGSYAIEGDKITFHFTWGGVLGGDYVPGSGGPNVQQPGISLQLPDGTGKYVMAQVPEELH